MAFDVKYGQVAVPGISEDEPIFILRAQDRFALPLILLYKSQVAALARVDDRMMSILRAVVFAFAKWPTTKIPD